MMAVYTKSLDCHNPPTLYQRRTKIVVPLCGRPLTVVDSAVPREPVFRISRPPEEVPTHIHHCVTGDPEAVHWKVAVVPGKVVFGAGVVIVGLLTAIKVTVNGTPE